MRPTPNTKTFLALLAMTVSTASAQDEYVAKLEDGSCEWNTFMCCWTSGEGMASTSDVCRVLDYPGEGDVVEMPRDSEGPVDCHGFGWGDDADVDSEILPLFYHLYDDVKYGGGYSGNVEGAPECGCVEEMPVVDDAECIRIALDGSIIPCNHGLRGYYRYDLDEPNGEMEMNLVNECDNTEVPDYDYRTCENNVYMCCWSEREGGLVKNTDVCRIGDTEYPGDSEGEIHCHGCVWPEDADDKFIHLLTQNMQNFDHRDHRGYSGTLPNAPMCACIEQMPEVSRADCTEYKEGGAEGGAEGDRFRSCVDLRTKFENEYPGRELNNLVEQCDNKEG